MQNPLNVFPIPVNTHIIHRYKLLSAVCQG